jgi:predicted Zn-dependent protease
MNRRITSFGLIALSAALVSCGEIGSPTRADIYEWRIIQTPDTFAFNWPVGEQPTKIWVQDIYDLPQHTQTAVDGWKSGFLYREWDAELVSDSSTADVIVLSDFPVGPTILLATVNACEGYTDLALDTETRVLTLPIRIYVVPRYDPELAETRECFGIVMYHEIGHALGIFRHSPDPGDIMYFNPTVSAPTQRDLQTAEVLYHAPTTVTTAHGDDAP